jgi:CheY-like chemotaxis protein
MTHILIIDDDLFELAVHIEALRDSGATVTSIDSIPDAIAFVADESNVIDLVIVDVMMPTEAFFSREATDEGRLTGICVVREIHELRPGVKIAVVSVRKDQKFLELLPSLQVAGVVFKPCMPKDFCYHVDLILKGGETCL